MRAVLGRWLGCVILKGMSQRSKQFPAQSDEPHKYWSSAHTKHRIRYHLVFIPKYRKRVLQGKVAARLEELLRQACEVNRWNLGSGFKSVVGSSVG